MKSGVPPERLLNKRAATQDRLSACLGKEASGLLRFVSGGRAKMGVFRLRRGWNVQMWYLLSRNESFRFQRL